MHMPMPSTLEAKSYQTMYVLGNNILFQVLKNTSDNKW